MEELRTLLKRDESYAIHALVTISETPGISTADVAQFLKLPPAYMAKVVRKLVQAGFVKSQMGRTGGLRLNADMSQVTMLDVIEAVSGRLILDNCQTHERCATQERKGHCNIKLAWFAATHQIRAVLADIRMSQLCGVSQASQGDTPPPVGA